MFNKQPNNLNKIENNKATKTKQQQQINKNSWKILEKTE